MNESAIHIQVGLDSDKVPQDITWSAPDNTPENTRKAKAFLLSLWDGGDKAALRIDLWTKDMMVDEMANFYFQVFTTMADTFEKATKHSELTADIKKFAKEFHEKFIKLESEKNK